MASEVLGTEIPAGPPDRGSEELEELLTVEEVAALFTLQQGSGLGSQHFVDVV